MWRSGENLLELVLSIYHVGSSSQEDQTQVLDVVFFYPPLLGIIFKASAFYLPEHLAWPSCQFF